VMYRVRYTKTGHVQCLACDHTWFPHCSRTKSLPKEWRKCPSCKNNRGEALKAVID